MKRVAVITILIIYFSWINEGIADTLQIDFQDQNQDIDLRLKAMNQTCDNILLRSNPDSAFLIAQKMFDLADASNNNLFKAEALRIQGESFHFRGNIPQALFYLEESLQLSNNVNYQKGIANAYSCIGNILTEQGKYNQALQHYEKSLEISNQIPDKIMMSNTLIAMGIIYYDLGDSPNSLSLLEKALDFNRAADDVRGMGRINNNIGVIYHEQENYDRALNYFEIALTLFEQAGEKRGMASSLNNIGDLYSNQGKYSEALPYNLKSLNMREELGDKRGMANCYNVIGDNLTQQRKYQEALEYYLKSAKIRDELEEKRAMSRVYGSIGHLYLIQDNYKKGKEWCDKANELSKSIGAKMEERESCDCLYQVYKALKNTDKALSYHERLNELEHELKSEETAKTLQKIEFKKIILEDSLKKEQDNIRIELKYQEEVNQKNKQRNIFMFIGLVILGITGGLYSRLRFIRKSRTIIQKEKERSDELLLNILPAETAAELKTKGSTKARHYDRVTVMFTDFKGFTFMAEKMSAQDLVNEIDFCFKKFDEITGKFNIEKIKTIGDAYMCAGGLPIPNQTNPIDVINAALEIQKFMLQLKQERMAAKEPFFELRLGIHTGPVVAGIVGTRKFQYDIWGDTVNIASRMESSGEVGQVNISQTTYENIKSHFKCTHRGKVEAKNKGAIDMYYVDARI